MKTNFLAGLIATLISLCFVLGAAIMLVVVFDIDAENNAFIIGIALCTIAIWKGLFSVLKPKQQKNNHNNS